MNQVVKWEEELARQAKEVAATERPSISTISLKSGVMRYQDQVVPGNKLQVVVAAFAFEHKWFKNKYDPDVIEIPACFALSETGKDMAPHEKSQEKQHEICASCDLFQFGSADNGKGKACKEVRRLALVPVDGIEGGEMALLSVPVTSVKNWSNYVNQVAAQYSRPPWAVITEISVVPDAKTQFKVTFSTAGMLSEDYLGMMHEKSKKALEVLLAPYEPIEQEETPAPKGKKKY